jgi:hypothetical protein
MISSTNGFKGFSSLTALFRITVDSLENGTSPLQNELLDRFSQEIKG